MSEDELEDFIESIPRDEKASSIAGWIEALNIFAKYADKGLDEKYFCGGEHDEVYFYIELDALPADSDDGRRLIALGFIPSLESENWLKFT